MNLYLTADRIGTPTGGGSVTFHESEALKSLGDTRIVSRDELDEANRVQPLAPDLDVDPWKWDALAYHQFGDAVKLAHVYAGTFSNCVDKLKKGGARVVYTAAAHDVAASRREHEKVGIPFNFPHLNDPRLWERYVRGYLRSDVLVCPSEHSATVMRNFGYSGRVEVIPHGVHLPDRLSPLPERFTVGYLGAVGPDKGLIYLLQAWGKLNYPDATLVVAGAQSTSPYVQALAKAYGGGMIHLKGWVENVSDFYDSISLYVQPSVTEGFGIEVLEALAHGRPTLCSRGAGAADVCFEEWKFGPCDPDALAAEIDDVKSIIDVEGTHWSEACREAAGQYTWDKVRARYVALWRELL